MNAKKENSKIDKDEESSVAYEVFPAKFKGVDRVTFDFNEEMRKGFAPEEFKAEMYKRIKAYPWENNFGYRF